MIFDSMQGKLAAKELSKKGSPYLLSRGTKTWLYGVDKTTVESEKLRDFGFISTNSTR